MSNLNSEVWDEFARITAKQLIKTAADKKDKSYNVVPEKAGPDTVIDETGYDLTELAHPDQVQISLSLLNDGIVENGVEIQKTMIDVARRNPRGVLSELIKTLVKIANFFDTDMTAESLKIAAEIDTHILKIAGGWADIVQPGLSDILERQDKLQTIEQHTPFQPVELNAVLAAAINALQNLDWSKYLFIGSEENKKGKATIDWVIKHLSNYQTSLKQGMGGGLFRVIQELAYFIIQADDGTRKSISMSSDWGNDPQVAMEAWNNLKTLADATYQKTQTTYKDVSDSDRGSVIPAPSLINKTRHGFLFQNDDVKKAQSSLGFVGNDIDGKFGPMTYNAVNKILPGLKYEEWTPEVLKKAIPALSLKTPISSQSDRASKVPIPASSPLLTPYDPNDKEEVAASAKNKQAKDFATYQTLGNLRAPNGIRRFPDLAVFEGRIYPYGTSPQQGQKAATSYLNTPAWINYLERGGITGRKAPWMGGGITGKEKD